MEIAQEEELVKNAKKDPEAFGKLYDAYYSQIYSYILKRTGHVEVAADITSETFFKALKNLWQFKFRNIKFSSWLYRIASNEIINYYRKNKHTSVALDEITELRSDENLQEEIMAAEDELQKHKDFLEIQKFITQLPEKDQEILTLRYFEKKKLAQIAEILGKKEGAVKVQIHRAIEKLRRNFN